MWQHTPYYLAFGIGQIVGPLSAVLVDVNGLDDVLNPLRPRPFDQQHLFSHLEALLLGWLLPISRDVINQEWVLRTIVPPSAILPGFAFLPGFAGMVVDRLLGGTARVSSSEVFHSELSSLMSCMGGERWST